MALVANQLFVPGAQSALPPARAAARLGGKAAGLLRLRALGLPVPDFAVLPVALFAPVLAGVPITKEGLAERRARLASFEVPAETRAALKAVLAGWDFPARPVAVRSSVADEDGAANAFPGMMDSVLSVSDWPALWAAVARVAASAYSDRALTYRRQRGLPLAAQPAVVVQRQVAARAAGVLFTTFPEYPLEMAIHAVAGLGEGLVGGQLVPEEFYLRKKDGQLVATVAERSGTSPPVGEAADLGPPDVETQCHSVLQAAAWPTCTASRSTSKRPWAARRMWNLLRTKPVKYGWCKPGPLPS